MDDNDRGWSKLVAFMLSGDPGSFVLWALLGYALWSAVVQGPFAKDRGMFPGDHDGDCDGGSD